MPVSQIRGAQPRVNNFTFFYYIFIEKKKPGTEHIDIPTFSPFKTIVKINKVPSFRE
jgi:hypothetical protein